MKRILLTSVALASILAVPACKREAAPTPAYAEQDAAAKNVAVEAPPADVEVISEAAHAPVSPEAAAAAPSFDTKAYAGTFADADTRLVITADGMFTLDQAGNASSGTWTLEKDGKHLLLDPDSKSEKDQRFEMIGNDELQSSADPKERLHRNKA